MHHEYKYSLTDLYSHTASTGTFAQLGKKMVYQGHGYWVHGFLSLLAQYNPMSLQNNLGRMIVS